MCILGILPALGLGGAATATAAGAAAGAATAASTLSTIGTLISVGGALYQGISGASAARQQSKAIEAQKQTEAQLNASQDQRQRAKFGTAMAQLRAETAARGVTLDSVTAVALGRTAAQEMSFESQATRVGGVARQQELTADQRMARAQGLSSMLKGTFSAAGTVLNAAPDLWPGFMQGGKKAYT